ncbi:hypothetical protein DA482_27945 [Pseudomonas fluorescens]|nr:hypothetical protein D0N73_03360 [Pseudomonas fluorescens]TWR47503.1 hypothetical protein FIP59_10710 [Pseudomonas fluorescens]
MPCWARTWAKAARRQLKERVQCGSGLARECGVSVSTSVTDTPHSRASPLPHFALFTHKKSGTREGTVRLKHQL